MRAAIASPAARATAAARASASSCRPDRTSASRSTSSSEQAKDLVAAIERSSPALWSKTISAPGGQRRGHVIDQREPHRAGLGESLLRRDQIRAAARLRDRECPQAAGARPHPFETGQRRRERPHRHVQGGSQSIGGIGGHGVGGAARDGEQRRRRRRAIARQDLDEGGAVGRRHRDQRPGISAISRSSCDIDAIAVDPHAAHAQTGRRVAPSRRARPA